MSNNQPWFINDGAKEREWKENQARYLAIAAIAGERMGATAEDAIKAARECYFEAGEVAVDSCKIKLLFYGYDEMLPFEIADYRSKQAVLEI